MKLDGDKLGSYMMISGCLFWAVMALIGILVVIMEIKKILQ